MAQPTPYDRQSSFTLLAQENPSTPYTGTDLDAEFNAVKVTLDELIANLDQIQRDDGALANQSVGPDQLASSIDLGINPPSAWAALTAYTQFDTAFNGTSLYRAAESHTSGAVFATDLAAGKWELLADFNTVSLADGSVTTAKLADGAATTAKIANNAVTNAKIIDDAVTTAKILDANVTLAKLATNSVSTAKIQDSAVVTAKIADANVTTVKILDANVTLAKLANMATASFLGRTTALAGVPEVLTATQATAMLNVVAGDSGAGGTKGLVPAPAAGDAAADKYVHAGGTFKHVGIAPDVIIEHSVSSGTNGGSITSGADRQRPLTTEVRDPLGICSLASNQFTLSAGTYYLEWASVTNLQGESQSSLYDVTSGASELKRGGAVSHLSTGGETHMWSLGQHTFTAAAPITLEIRERCTGSKATDGFGHPLSWGTEVYAVVKIWKTA